MEAKKEVNEYAQDEKERSHVDVAINSTHVININLWDKYLDLLKGEENNSSKSDFFLPHVCNNSDQSLNHLKELIRWNWNLVIYAR